MSAQFMFSRCAAIALFLAALFGFAALPESTLFVSPAHADDDDDDDDDDGGGWGFDDNVPRIILREFRLPRLGKRVRTQSPRRAARTANVRPLRAPDEIVAAGATASGLTLLTSRGFTILEQSEGFAGGESIVRLRIPRGRGLEAARDDVRSALPLAAVDFNHYYRPNTGEDCDSIHCRTIRLVKWPALDDKANACTGQATIGMVDTDINVAHAALSTSKIDLIKLHEGKTGSGAEHGTAIAALLVGAPSSRSPGIVPDARLIAVDAFERIGRSDDRADAYSLARAIALLVAREVRVINLSLTGPPNDAVAHAIRHSAAKDIVVVASAGNDGPRAKPAYPAAYPDVIAVTAVDRNLRVYRRAGQGEHVDLAAPGVGIWTAASIRGAKTRTGTSFAAPFVSAAAALIRARAPSLDRNAIYDLLSASARDLGKPGRDPIFGAGLLQVSHLCESSVTYWPARTR